MDLHPSMSYRITTLEIEQAAIRAERARMAAEHADQIVRRDGILRRVLHRLRTSRGTADAARATVADGAPAASAPRTATAPAGPVAAAVPAGAPAALSAEDARERELVGCAPHAA